jgi:hypothetical protein
MGTIHCPGGHTFSDGQIPCPYEWKLISDENLDVALDEVENLDWKAEFAGDKADWAIRGRSLITYRCPHCERMLVFEHGIDKPATSYRRE